MNNDEAKFILNGYRPDGSDGRDSIFCEALQQARSDPALGAWLARSQAHDAAVAGKLTQIPPPAGLREAILTGGRVSRGRRTIWFQPGWLAAAAAAVVLVVAAAAWWPKRAAADTTLVKFAMIDASEDSKHGGHGAETSGLQAELSEASMHLSQGVRMDFAALEKTGCRTLDVEGRAVLEVCFNRNGSWFHCYIARCDDFPALAAKQGPTFAVNGKVNAVSWADGAHRFVVAGQVEREAVERLL